MPNPWELDERAWIFRCFCWPWLLILFLGVFLGHRRWSPFVLHLVGWQNIIITMHVAGGAMQRSRWQQKRLKYCGHFTMPNEMRQDHQPYTMRSPRRRFHVPAGTFHRNRHSSQHGSRRHVPPPVRKTESPRPLFSLRHKKHEKFTTGSLQFVYRLLKKN